MEGKVYYIDVYCPRFCTDLNVEEDGGRSNARKSLSGTLLRQGEDETSLFEDSSLAVIPCAPAKRLDRPAKRTARQLTDRTQDTA